MMKKWTVLLLCFLMALPLFGLAEEVTPPAFLWERNAREHWRVLESGGKADLAPHSLDGIVCTVCGSEIWLYDDGSADIYDYDEYGNILRITTLDAQNAVVAELVYAYEYDAEGRMVFSREFFGGVLSGESTYTVNTEGDCIPVTQYGYYDDGTWALNEYDEHGNCVHAIVCDGEDNIISETISEYTLGSDGWYYESRTATYLEGGSFLHAYNEYGDVISTLNTNEKGEVWADHTYEYEYEDGVMLWCRMYDSGRLSRESVYGGGRASLLLETDYYDDGTKIVSEYNALGDPVKVTHCRADGSVEMEQTYAYDYDGEGNLRTMQAFVDGQLVIHTEYALTADGWSYVARETMYDADGSRTVFTFDENEELVSGVSYDPAGNVIE